MRLYHPQHGYHFETGTDQVQALKVIGWVEAPKGFQNTLIEEQEEPKTEIKHVITARSLNNKKRKG